MRLKKLAGLACLLALTATVQARALMIAPPPGGQRVVTADGVIVGKVVRLEPKTVFAARFPGDKEKGEYVVAVVKIDESLVGLKGEKEVRVAFLAPPPPPAQPEKGPIVRPPLRRYPQASLAADQEALLFLHKHSDEKFYVLTNYYDVVNKKDNASFAKELESVKRAAKLLADPKAGFESKSAEDRFLTAALLLTRYQTVKQGTVGQPKMEPIPADESKQILLALADADWTNNSGSLGFQMTPQAMFSRLPNKTGWVQPKDFKEFPAAAKKWLKDNAETYRVQKLVSEAPSDK